MHATCVSGTSGTGTAGPRSGPGLQPPSSCGPISTIATLNLPASTSGTLQVGAAALVSWPRDVGRRHRWLRTLSLGRWGRGTACTRPARAPATRAWSALSLTLRHQLLRAALTEPVWASARRRRRQSGLGWSAASSLGRTPLRDLPRVAGGKSAGARGPDGRCGRSSCASHDGRRPSAGAGCSMAVRATERRRCQLWSASRRGRRRS